MASPSSIFPLVGDLPRTLRWSTANPRSRRYLLTEVLADPAGAAPAQPLGELERTATGGLRGTLAGTGVQIAAAGRRRPGLRLTLSGVSPRTVLPDLAGFMPDWSGLGPIEVAGRTRYMWARGAWFSGGAVIRDAAGAGVVRLLPEGDLDAPGAQVEVYCTLPDGHAAALVLLGWSILLRELSGATPPHRLDRPAAVIGEDDWM